MTLLATIWAWLAANWDTLLATAFAIEVVAVTLVNLTPTPVDNKVLVGIHRMLVAVANIIPNTKVTSAKEKADEAMKNVT